jgi:hypothetical protein
VRGVVKSPVVVDQGIDTSSAGHTLKGGKTHRSMAAVLKRGHCTTTLTGGVPMITTDAPAWLRRSDQDVTWARTVLTPRRDRDCEAQACRLPFLSSLRTYATRRARAP